MKRRLENRCSASEIKLNCSNTYRKLTKNPSKVKPVWLQDNYGVVKEGKHE